VNESSEDVGIVVGEVERGGVGFLLDRGGSDLSWKEVVAWIGEGK
jgi:hypothetical protein